MLSNLFIHRPLIIKTMIALFLSGLIALLLFISFGFFTTKILRIESTYIEKIITGLIVVNTLTCSVSIFTSVSFYILLCFILAALLLTFYIRKELAEAYQLIRSSYMPILFAIPFIVISFTIALQEPSVFDSGLYHIQAIKWIEEHATVPGLANLHHRFGFNPIAFSLYALTSCIHLFNQEIFSINIVLFSVFAVYFTNKLYTTLKNEGINTYFIFYSIFFYVLILLNSKISSPSPDYISSVFLLFIFLRMIEIDHAKQTATFQTFVPIILLSVYCVMSKLSTLPVCFISGYILFTYRTNRKAVLCISMGAILICLPWFINTVLLTGWLIYPFPALDLFSFDWKVPATVVQQANAEIIGWARSPNDFYYEVSQMPLTKWMPVWWSYLTGYVKLLIAASIAFPMILFIAQRINLAPTRRLLDLCTFTAVAGVLFWLFTAPDFRFGHIFILIAACIPLLYFNATFSLFKKTSILQKQLFFLTLCALLLFKSIRNNYGLKISECVYTLKNNCVKPQKINSTHATFMYVYVGNEKIYKPMADERCFDHVIPCSHSDVSSIELRGATVSDGFRQKLKKY